MAKAQTRTPTIFEQRLFGVNTELLSHPAAERALTKGTLRAKRSALRTATILSWLSWPLLIAVLVVSFTHLAEQVARVVPNGTSALRISDEVYNGVALANTGLVDTIALYLVAVSTIAYFAGQKAGRLQWFYLAMTLALNAGYVLRHYPAVNDLVADYILMVDVAIAALLILMVPVSIFGVEHAQRVVEHIRLALLAEVTTYQDILAAQEGEEPEEVKQLREDHRIIRERAIKLEQHLNELKTAMGAYPDSDLISLATALNRSALAYDDFVFNLRETIGDAWGEMDPLTAVRHLVELAHDHENATKARLAAEGEVTRLEDLVTQAEQYAARMLAEKEEAERRLRELTAKVTAEWRARQAQAQAALPAPVVVEDSKAAIVHTCDVCHQNGLSATDKGIAGRAKWQKVFGEGVYACKTCREKAVAEGRA